MSVTTQDVVSDLWDGNIATSFAGGSGTYIDPYIIKTGGQLLLAKNYSNKYFELGGNIDLNNKNWLPYKFSGNLDGKGFSISNLYIDRIDNYQGLFSECSGFVSNLTVKQVSINAGECTYIGTISGKGGTFSNCKVILGNASKIAGKQYVGGISGSGAKLSNCTIESTGAEIKGVSHVGGIIGSLDKEMIDCSADVNVSGANTIGGLAGWVQSVNSCYIESCSFKGKVTGDNKIGGVIGYCDSYNTRISLKGVKVDATITATNGNAGGLIGEDRNGYSSEMYGCYSKGSISATGQCGGLVGLGTTNCNLCYSSMTSSSSSYYGLGKEVRGRDCATVNAKSSGYYSITNFKSDCTNITTFLQECYSQYASYWNFNKSWVWEGNVGGNAVKVNCPCLSWE